MKDNIGKNLHWKLGRYRICVGITMTFVFRNRPLVIGDLGMKFTNTDLMFRNPVVNVFHCQAIEMCVGYDIVKREDVKTTTESPFIQLPWPVWRLDNNVTTHLG